MGQIASPVFRRALMRLWGALAALVLATPLAAQEFEPDCAAAEEFLAEAVEQGRTVGASVLIWQGSEEACFAASGDAVREEGKAFSRDTLVQVFSMTKPVTGVALMQLWEKGAFGLDDPLQWYLPEYQATRVLTGEREDGSAIVAQPKRAITVRDVLRHTAGFSYGPGGEPQNAADRTWQELDPLSADNTLAQFSQKLAQVPLLYEPGTHWSYSAGVDVQARLVEVLSGQPFDSYVEQHIFDPLGMADSGWKRDEADLARLARIYVAQDDGTLEPMPRDEWLKANFMGKPMTMGGSGIVTTVDDYMRFARMLLGEGELDGVRILEPATVQLMATDHLDPRVGPENRSWLVGKGNGGFGFDFFVRTGPPRDAEENRGTTGEFFWDGLPSMLFWVDPVQDMAVVFATQKIDFDGTLHHDIRDAIYGADYTGAK